MAKPLPKDSSAISVGIMGPMMEHRSETVRTELNKHLNNSSVAIRVKTKLSYLKTRICSKWEITGQCPYGESCNFAHGQSAALRPMYW